MKLHFKNITAYQKGIIVTSNLTLKKDSKSTPTENIANLLFPVFLIGIIVSSNFKILNIKQKIEKHIRSIYLF